MEALLSQGKELGLEGKLLLDFIEKQQAIQREERKEQRAAAAEENQRQIELRKLEAAEQEMKLNHEREMEKARLAHELEMEKARIEGNGDGNHRGNGHSNKARTPKLPVFIDGKDDLDAYLERFERYATTQEWKKEDWATDLSALLTGKALGVYARLSVDDAVDYDKVKEALLKRYQLTEEGFRVKFRESQPEFLKPRSVHYQNQ